MGNFGGYHLPKLKDALNLFAAILIELQIELVDCLENVNCGVGLLLQDLALDLHGYFEYLVLGGQVSVPVLANEISEEVNNFKQALILNHQSALDHVDARV